MPAAPTEEENLWANILDEVQSRSSSSLPQASVLVLGDNESGKTSLIASLQHNTDAQKGAGLEYQFLDVNPDYKDDVGPGESARLCVWVMDGDTHHAGLMKFALQSAALDKCLLLLCASMTSPWALLDSLNRWARVIQDYLDSSSSLADSGDRQSKELFREASDRQVRFWQEYVEPLDSSSHSDAGVKVPSMETDASQILLPLGDGILTENIGLPVVVVISKADYMSTLEKEFDFKDEQFDYIQLQIRRFCLKYGAALIYTSVKEGRNCDLLYKYVLHRIYGFPFTHPALVIERDSIFIPAGWDNDKKISILYENLVNLKPDDLYSDVVHKPVLRRPVTKGEELTAEDEQSFLSRQLSVVNSQTPPPAQQRPQDVSPARSPNVTHKQLGGGSSATKITATPSAQPTSGSKKVVEAPTPKLVAQVPGATTNEGVLANFFNQLLNKKTGNAASPSPQPNLNQPKFDSVAGDKSEPLSPEQAEQLQRILENTKKSSLAMTPQSASAQSQSPAADGDRTPVDLDSADDSFTLPQANGPHSVENGDESFASPVCQSPAKSVVVSQAQS